MKRYVFITGAGHGLGKAIADAFCRSGFHVLAADIDTDALASLPQHERFRVFTLDVTKEHEVEQTARSIARITKRLDVLVSNAGVFDFFPVAEAGSEKLRHIFDVNTFALSSLTRHFGGLLRNGRLIVIGSESYKVPSPFQPYAVSKQALEALFRAISLEMATQGVRSILIRPGAMQTRILEETVHFGGKYEGSPYSKPFAKFLQTVPRYIGKIAEPERIAVAVLKAATVKNPKAVYNINHNPLISLLAMLPQNLQRRLVLRTLKSE